MFCSITFQNENIPGQYDLIFSDPECDEEGKQCDPLHHDLILEGQACSTFFGPSMFS